MRRDGDVKLFAGTGNPKLAEAIAGYLGLDLGKLKISQFSDGETYVKFDESVRGVDAFVIQPTSPPVDHNLVQLLILMDALKRASADRVTAVIPYYGYARQEKKDKPREPITAKMIADVLTAAGADRIITMDLHADAIPGFFNIPVDHLTAISTIAQYIRSKNLPDMVIVSPDEGRVKKVRQVTARLQVPLAVGYKFHPEHLVSEVTHLAGDVEDKTPIIVEDMITTGGSVNECVDALLEHGCKPEIYVCATHGVFAGEAFKKLGRPEIREIIVTDTIAAPDNNALGNLTVLSVAPLFGEAIRCVHDGLSIASLFD